MLLQSDLSFDMAAIKESKNQLTLIKLSLNYSMFHGVMSQKVKSTLTFALLSDIYLPQVIMPSCKFDLSKLILDTMDRHPFLIVQ